MKRLLLISAFLLLAIPVMATKRVAVLETISEKGVIGRSEKMFLTEKLRERAKAALPAHLGYVITTRENIQQMLPSGMSIDDCDGICLVEIGKKIAADYVAQARVGKFGNQLTITVELYETAGNNLVGSFAKVKKDAVGVLSEIEDKSDSLFKLITRADLKQTSSSRDVSSAPKKAGILKDVRDGQTYKTVKIGSQVWMAENLNYEMQDSYCYQGYESNCYVYGRLYEWDVARKSCPRGWHLPSKAEFEKLFKFVGGQSKANSKLKSKNGWNRNGNGLDVFGFSALPAGYRDGEGKYDDEGFHTYFWSSTEGGSGAYYMLLAFYDKAILDDIYKNYYFPVRCLKNEP